MKALTIYEVSPEDLPKIMPLFPAHRALLGKYHDEGVLLMAGPFGNPPVGAVGIFTSREAAEAFAKEDPFVVNGAVRKVTVYDWNDVDWNA